MKVLLILLRSMNEIFINTNWAGIQNFYQVGRKNFYQLR